MSYRHASVPLLLVGCAGAATAAAGPAAPSFAAVPLEPVASRDAPVRPAEAELAAAAASATIVDTPAAGASAPLIHLVVERAAGYEGASRTEKLKAAVEIARKVLSDPEYAQVMRAYPGIHSLLGFSQATLFGGGDVTSNDQPMTELLRGNGSDGQVHIWLETEDHGHEDGHTVQNAAYTGVTFSKGKVIDQMTVAQLADHLVHEHMHRIGFQHARHRSLERCDSVPYAFGRTVCEFATRKYGLPGSCDKPTDWPPGDPRKHPEPGPPC